MATYVIELTSGMVHAIEAASGPDAGVTGFIFRDEVGEVVAIVPHGVTIIRKDAVAGIPADEIEAAEQRGFERGRDHLASQRQRIFDDMAKRAPASEGTLAGATVPASDIDLCGATYEPAIPGDGPIPPTAPLQAYEGEYR